jgi:hypothetical protein
MLDFHHMEKKMRLMLVLLSFLLLTACNSAKDTPLPRELEQMDSIKPAMEKLSAEERELALGYIMRHTVAAKLGGLFGGKEGPGIPEGMTIGKAIEEQLKFKADAAIEEARRQALKAKLQAEREAAQKQMREAITVTLVSKELASERGYSGMVIDENLRVKFGYRNNTGKDVAGVKGHVSIKDLFGEEISGFVISNDTTIPAGQSVTWAGQRSVSFSLGNNKDRKFAELGEDKYKVVWEPEMIVFKDGSKLTAVSD